MKTSALVVMSAFLMSAAVPAFAFTNQDQFVCELAQVNCPAEAEILKKTTVRSRVK